MIIIVSSVTDESTNRVLDWLSYYDENNFFIVNQETINNNGEVLDNVEGSLLSSVLPNYEIELKDCYYVTWFRRLPRYNLPKDEKDIFLKANISEYNREVLLKDIHKENEAFREAVWIYLDLKSHFKLGTYKNIVVNKIDVLRNAAEVGLLVPKTLVSNVRTSVEIFAEKCCNKIITKPLYEGVNLYSNGCSYNTYTEEVDIDELPDRFCVSLFQEQIEKLLELRIFYLTGDFYSMAIFSQLDVQTSVDFRRYNTTKGNRTVPFKLPTDIEDKLRRLLQLYDMNSASIDMIKDTSGNYIFLEINPVGQYNMTSDPCNYFLNQKIAKILINANTAKES